MAKIPKINDLNSIMEEGLVIQDHRNYLGYSSLGKPCIRAVWYSFRWVKDVYITQRIQRIFDRGHLEEMRIISDLEAKGCVISDVQRVVTGAFGHIKGHIDGTVLRTPTAEKTLHLLEMKTMKQSKFAEYIKKGLKKFNPAYYQQIHSYMGKFGLERCLYVVTNKDTEERDYKRIQIDDESFDDGERRSKEIIMSEFPPNKIQNASRTFIECKFCDYMDVCHKNKQIKKSCRTCIHWNIEDDGKFSCSEMNIEFTGVEDQLSMEHCEGGENYKLDPIYKECK